MVLATKFSHRNVLCAIYLLGILFILPNRQRRPQHFTMLNTHICIFGFRNVKGHRAATTTTTTTMAMASAGQTRENCVPTENIPHQRYLSSFLVLFFSSSFCMARFVSPVAFVSCIWLRLHLFNRMYRLTHTHTNTGFTLFIVLSRVYLCCLEFLVWLLWPMSDGMWCGCESIDYFSFVNMSKYVARSAEPKWEHRALGTHGKRRHNMKNPNNNNKIGLYRTTTTISFRTQERFQLLYVIESFVLDVRLKIVQYVCAQHTFIVYSVEYSSS